MDMGWMVGQRSFSKEEMWMSKAAAEETLLNANKLEYVFSLQL